MRIGELLMFAKKRIPSTMMVLPQYIGGFLGEFLNSSMNFLMDCSRTARPRTSVMEGVSSNLYGGLIHGRSSTANVHGRSSTNGHPRTGVHSGCRRRTSTDLHGGPDFHEGLVLGRPRMTRPWKIIKDIY